MRWLGGLIILGGLLLLRMLIGTTERELARVTIEIGGQARKELVALAKEDVNCGKGLLSIDLESDKDFQLVELCR